MYTSRTMYNPCHYVHRYYGLTRLQSESLFFSDIDSNCTYSEFSEQQKSGVSLMPSFYSHNKWYNCVSFSVFFSDVERVWKVNTFMRRQYVCLIIHRVLKRFFKFIHLHCPPFLSQENTGACFSLLGKLSVTFKTYLKFHEFTSVYARRRIYTS